MGYEPGLAQLNFCVDPDWSYEEAKILFKSKTFPFEVNQIQYQDCIKGMKKIPSNSIDLIIADPPFGISFNGKEQQYNRKSDYVIDGYVEVSEGYDLFSKEWILELARIMKQKASLYIVSGWSHLNEILNALKKTNLKIINHIIWKFQFGNFTKHRFVSSHYHILFCVKNEKSYFFNKYLYYPEDVWEIPRDFQQKTFKNGTKLPVELIQKMIQFSSKPGDLVLDPFMGNATTAITAKSLFRHYYGFELNQSMKKFHDSNLVQIKTGQNYVPLNSFLPSKQELLQKYPNLKKYIEPKNRLDSFLKK